MRAFDHTGRVFGRLTARRRVKNRGKRAFWLFSCSCGASKEIHIASVVGGRVQSCGCLHIERCKLGKNPTKHGDAKVGDVKRLHSIWRGMLKRCNPKNNPHAIKRYAARGIGVAKEWQDYITFRAWALSNGYKDNLSLDRIDNNAGYSPQNCRWADRKTQARNRATSRFFQIGKEKLTLAEWCERMSISPSAVQSRLTRGWSVERAISVPVKVVAKTW